MMVPIPREFVGGERNDAGPCTDSPLIGPGQGIECREIENHSPPYIAAGHTRTPTSGHEGLALTSAPLDQERDLAGISRTGHGARREPDRAS